MLLDSLYNKYKIVSIVGMAKNSGKTVALNHLISEAMRKNITLGIVSTGRDGESVDLVTETKKPKIFAEVGTIISTTTEMLTLGDATIEIIHVTDYRTPLGEIIIGRIKGSGYIQIAGPQRVSEIKEVCSLMLDLGAELVIVDGALDRRASAAPSISEATILSTGAVVSRDMNKVIEETIHVVSLFNLASVEDPRAIEAIESLVSKGEVGIVDRDYTSHPIEIKTALNCGNIIGENLNEDSKYIVIPGCLVKSTLEDIMIFNKKHPDIEIVVIDGTKIFVQPKDWLLFMRRGINIKVLHSIDLAAITVNPYAPEGYFFEPKELLEQLKFYIKDIPVVDLVLEGN